jgi:hypothetical protein
MNEDDTQYMIRLTRKDIMDIINNYGVAESEGMGHMRPEFKEYLASLDPEFSDD